MFFFLICCVMSFCAATLMTIHSILEIRRVVRPSIKRLFQKLLVLAVTEMFINVLILLHLIALVYILDVSQQDSIYVKILNVIMHICRCVIRVTYLTINFHLLHEISLGAKKSYLRNLIKYSYYSILICFATQLIYSIHLYTTVGPNSMYISLSRWTESLSIHTLIFGTSVTLLALLWYNSYRSLHGILTKTTIFIVTNIFVWFPSFLNNVSLAVYTWSKGQITIIPFPEHLLVQSILFYSSASLSGICNYFIWMKYLSELAFSPPHLSASLRTEQHTSGSWNTKSYKENSNVFRTVSASSRTSNRTFKSSLSSLNYLQLN